MDWLEGRTDTVKKETSPSQRKNEYKKYSDWINMIKQQCNEKNYVRTEFLEEPDSQKEKFMEYIKNIEDEETKLLKLQTQYRTGEIKEEQLTKEQVSSLCDLYDKQIANLKKSNEIRKQKILDYKRKIQNA